MKSMLAAVSMAMFLGLISWDAQAQTDTTGIQPGLVAHYFMDPTNWNGKWPETLSEPTDDPKNWTFTEYKYSRVEPVVNHLFVMNGWFSVRWTGYFDPLATGGSEGAMFAVKGRININPSNSESNEFALVMADGTTITRDMLADGYAGISGPATVVAVRPKGNGSQNGLTVDGKPFALENSARYEIFAPAMTVKLHHEKARGKGGMGQWWLDVDAKDASILKDGVLVGAAAPAAGKAAAAGVVPDCEYFFQIWADDGCRLFIDGKLLIDDWIACWEARPKSLRQAKPMNLSPGPHEIVVEYFQGQSLKLGDSDPMKLYWSCPARKIPRQLVGPANLSHGDKHLKSVNR
ncbi:MAG: hypothetical protein C0404_02240 [Verrucomicrobia bacterium]|nr:hypothetical protein [Verrucomicrobiota bacterium]